MLYKSKKLSPAKEAAYIAFACALTIVCQYALSFVAGVELVTVIFTCFACVFGIRLGVAFAFTFCFLRCFVFGFYPTALVLYLSYFPLYALVCGLLGKIKKEAFYKPDYRIIIAVNVIFVGIAVLCVILYALDIIKVSKYIKAAITVLLLAIAAVCFVLAATFDALVIIKAKGKTVPPDIFRAFLFAAVAAFSTVCFTLLDDIITPLMLGYSELTALTYFYASFSAMLPQVICACATVLALFAPLTKVLYKYR